MKTIMNYIHRIAKAATFKKAGVAVLLVVSVLGTLYIGEATFSGDAHVPFADAWNCESMTATPATITEGQSSKIAWKFSDDKGITVTIDKIAGKTWSGVSGNTSVSPTETTKYTAIAHKSGSSATMKCSVTVTVKPAPAPEAVCTLTADKTTVEEGQSAKLTWTSQNAVSASMNQGIGNIALNDSRDVTPTATTTYTALFKNKDGKEVTCEKTIAVTPKPAPQPSAPVCSLSISASSVNKGDSATLTWTSDNVDSASIDNGVGDVATSGSQTVTVNDATTYTGTFRGTNGSTITCTASVSIISSGGGSETPPTGGGSSGGGGVCRNCGSSGGSSSHTSTPSSNSGSSVTKEVSPNVVLSSSVTPAPYVYLSQVPYTGFEAGPVLTAIFWFAVLALSVLIAYVMSVPQPLSQLARLFARKQETETVVASVLQPAMPTPIAWNPTPVTDSAIHFAAAHASDSDDDIIEERAQADHILLSPEALRAVAMEADRSSMGRDAFFTAVFEEAKASFPREDGWILLSKERINAVLSAVRSVGGRTATASASQHAEARTETRAPYSAAMTYKDAEPKTHVQASTTTHVAASRTYAPAEARPTVAVAKEVSIAEFVAFLEQGEQQKAFETLRALTAKGLGEQYVKSLVRALDDVYKNRIEGGRAPQADLARVTATWSNADFEAVLGTLVESVDWSYSSARVGTKIALAKAFEYFESKKA